MQLPMVNFASADEDATYNYRWSLFEKFINEQDANSSISINDNENKVDPEIVSILNLPSLKRGTTLLICVVRIFQKLLLQASWHRKLRLQNLY